MPIDCVFCERVLGRADAEIVGCEEKAIAFRDAYPSAPGHTLIIPIQHVERLRLLPFSAVCDMWALAMEQLDRLGADGYTVGWNDGVLAGQTVPHVHLHIIPRNAGDVDDPKGGLRWVLPTTAPYWTTA